MKTLKVEIAGVNTSSLPTLTNEQMKELLLKSKNGDIGARKELIEGNLRLILSLLKRFSYMNESADDLFQIGAIGLMKAIDNFDFSHDVKFSTYAVPMIEGEIRRHARDRGNTTRVSRSVRDLAYKAMKVKERLLFEMGREPSVKEIAKVLDVKDGDVEGAFEAIMEPISLYEPMYQDSEGDVILTIDHIADTKSSEGSWTDDLAIRQAIEQLRERDRKVVLMRYFQEKTQIEVSEELGISQAQVSRLERAAVEQIGKHLKS